MKIVSLIISVFVAAQTRDQHWEETHRQEIPTPDGSAGLWISMVMVWVTNMGVDTIWFEASCYTLSFMAI